MSWILCLMSLNAANFLLTVSTSGNLEGKSKYDLCGFVSADIILVVD